MTMFAVYQISDGKLVSVGSVVADPLPAGLAAVALTTAEAQAFRDGLAQWNPATHTVTILPPDPAIANEQTIRQRAETALTGNSTFLADSNVTTAEAVTQLKAITRQVNGLIRLTINKLDNISDT